ncbi:MAG: S-methyl-5-thioribose-1-phosphate isomerase [Bacteroidales bacterium]|nr:S-methyl-5-thioribose-1-phosphate isomerase [Bacteroidales bacterium]
MRVGDKHFQSIWVNENDSRIIQVIDQRALPFQLIIKDLHTPDDVIYAISEMVVRGAPLIGVTAAFGVYLAVMKFKDSRNADNLIQEAAITIKETRPTAVNLEMAVDLQLKAIQYGQSMDEKLQISFDTAFRFMHEEILASKNIGLYGKNIIEEIAKTKNGSPVNILTHCNAGWLATVDFGTASAPIYLAHDSGIPVHVWVDETRPRNQGARLTAWELGKHGVSHTIIVDNAGGHLMQMGKVDIVIVGSDRTALNGDTANKIGTYLKALAAYDNDVPFYVALPVSSIDWTLEKGLNNIPIEERSEDEIHFIDGLSSHNKLEQIRITPENSKAVNYGFDVTPAKFICGIITDKGICKANTQEIKKWAP